MTPHEAKALALVAVGKIEAQAAADQRKRDDMRQSFLNDQEMEQLILAFLRTREDGIITEAEVAAIVNEVITIRFMHSCTELVLKGLLNIDYDPSQPVNDRLIFKARKDIQGPLQEALQRRASGGS